ncbi:MAG: hypothetical protein ACP5NX_01605 [Candidatus Bilamarchaeaceae archaeon]
MKLLLVLGLIAMLALSGCVTAQERISTEANKEIAAQAQTGNLTSAQVASLVGAGKSYICTYSYDQDGVKAKTTAYGKGENVRGETTVDADGMGLKTVTIMKSGKLYMDATLFSGMGIGAGCAWLMVDPEEMAGTGGYDMVQANEMVSKYQADCRVADVGDDKFSTPGKVCDFTATVKEMYKDLPGYAACKDKPYKEFSDCIQKGMQGAYGDYTGSG